MLLFFSSKYQGSPAAGFAPALPLSFPAIRINFRPPPFLFPALALLGPTFCLIYAQVCPLRLDGEFGLPALAANPFFPNSLRFSILPSVSCYIFSVLLYLGVVLWPHQRRTKCAGILAW